MKKEKRKQGCLGEYTDPKRKMKGTELQVRSDCP
jgi:hypothetical protein